MFDNITNAYNYMFLIFICLISSQQCVRCASNVLQLVILVIQIKSPHCHHIQLNIDITLVEKNFKNNCILF